MTANTRRDATTAITRGVRRRLEAAGLASITEFTPTPGLRVDVIALASDGEIWIVEVKSGTADFRADAKWPRYLPWCDRFFFAVDAAFPERDAPAPVGLMIADGYDAEIVRPAPLTKLAPARRRALTLRIARLAAQRLFAFEDAGERRLEAPPPA